jgi:hypothetical protein
MYVISGVQNVDDFLLNTLVLGGIQRIDVDDFGKDRFEVTADFW